jgi:hypothetical protein
LEFISQSTEQNSERSTIEWETYGCLSLQIRREGVWQRIISTFRATGKTENYPGFHWQNKGLRGDRQMAERFGAGNARRSLRTSNQLQNLGQKTKKRSEFSDLFVVHKRHLPNQGSLLAQNR